MEVRHGFAGVRAVVHDEAEAARELQLLRHHAGGEEEVAEHGLLIRLSFADAGNDDLRDDKQMHGRLWLDVMDDDAVIVLVFDLGGDFPGDDAFEEGWHGSRVMRGQGCGERKPRLEKEKSQVGAESGAGGGEIAHVGERVFVFLAASGCLTPLGREEGGAEIGDEQRGFGVGGQSLEPGHQFGPGE